MKKNKRILLLVLIGAFAMTACSDGESAADADTAQSSSTANITEESSGDMIDMTIHSVVVSYEEDTLTIARVDNGGDLYRLTLEEDKLTDVNGDPAGTAKLEPATVVDVVFNGIVAHSYPAMIPNYSSIVVYDEKNEDTLLQAQDALSSLQPVEEEDVAE